MFDFIFDIISGIFKFLIQFLADIYCCGGSFNKFVNEALKDFYHWIIDKISEAISWLREKIKVGQRNKKK